MSRRRAAKKRHTHPDAKFGSVSISKFINRLMEDGKKSVAERIVYNSLDIISNKLGVNPVEVFDKIISNIRPLLEVRSRRVGGATYQIPVEVREDRSVTLAAKWWIDTSRKRKSEKEMAEKLAAEGLDAYNERGAAIKKRDDTHKMAEANRAFAHYRW